MFMLAPATGMGGGYTIKNSLRFNSADSASMTRTFSASGTTATFSFWLKRTALGTTQRLFGWTDGSANSFGIQLTTADQLDFWNYNSGFNARKTTSAVYRDVSAWYHIVCVLDTTNATGEDRLRIYVNGVRQTSFVASTIPTQSLATNLGASHTWAIDGTNGYVAEYNFIDGQALDATYFGKTDSVTGQWVPKKYTGTYGTAGFYLPFDDGTSTTTLGYDRSGNGNNWTLTNFTRSAGVNDDWMQDTPTNNYCTLNQLSGNKAVTSPKSYVALTDGALRITGPASNWTGSDSTFYVSSGKWYWEWTLVAEGTDNYHTLGVIDETNNVYYTAQNRVVNDVVSFKLDMDVGTLEQSVNGAAYTTVTSALSGLRVSPWCQVANANVAVLNFGQRAFAYTPPTGFKALCTKNLPTPTIKKPNQYFDVKTYTGNGATQSITGLNFQPDFVWLKSRSFVQSNNLYDAARGVTKALYSDLTNAETTDANGLTSFNADGFSIGSSAGSNQNTSTYVAWNWKAGGAPVTNTDGAISSQVSANVTAGFSVVTFTGDGATSATVGHGLGAAPQLYFIAPRNATGGFAMVHILFDGTVDYMFLNSTAANGNASQTVPTSTVFNVRADAAENTSGRQNVVYCFAEKAGFSKFGKYTGNGSADGPFMYCGFKPRYLLIKRMDTTASWYVTDGVRDIFNEEQLFLYPNLSNAESTGTAGVYREDFLSNGFKLRGTGADINASGGTYIFLAFAESPFKYSTAR